MGCCDLDQKQDPKAKSLSERIDAVGWALFFIMIGVLLLVPEGRIPETAWLVGAGLIMLGGNAARRIFGIKMEGCTLGLGIIAVLFGISGFFGANVPVFPILLILIGANIILRPLFRKNKK